jgi:hypothetical protein
MSRLETASRATKIVHSLMTFTTYPNFNILNPVELDVDEDDDIMDIGAGRVNLVEWEKRDVSNEGTQNQCGRI